MHQVTQAMATICSQRPPQLPPIDTPALPELDAVRPLAEIAGADPSNVLTTGAELVADRETIAQTVAAARPLIDAAGRDIVALALELGQRALPHAVASLLPIPGLQAGAQAQLTLLAEEFAARAMQRIGQLVGELDEVARPLYEIAEKEPARVTTAEGEAAVDDLERIAEKPQEFQALGAEETTLIPGPEAPAGGDNADNTAGEAAVAAAKAQIGVPYVWGGTGDGGFDCSGLTQFAYAQAGVDIPRTAEEQAVGRQVTADELQAGDLVVWDGHVAMYAGDGTMVEAGDPVQTNPLRTSNLGMAFKGFWRPTG